MQQACLLSAQRHNPGLSNMSAVYRRFVEALDRKRCRQNSRLLSSGIKKRKVSRHGGLIDLFAWRDPGMPITINPSKHMETRWRGKPHHDLESKFRKQTARSSSRICTVVLSKTRGEYHRFSHLPCEKIEQHMHDINGSSST